MAGHLFWEQEIESSSLSDPTVVGNTNGPGICPGLGQEDEICSGKVAV